MYILENPTRSVVIVRVVYDKNNKEVFTVHPYTKEVLTDRQFQLLEGDRTQKDVFKQLSVTRISDELADTTEEILELVDKAISEQGFGGPVELLPDQGNQSGNEETQTRADHVHNIPTDVPIGIPLDNLNQKGENSSFARSDHLHQLNTAAPTTKLSASTSDQKGAAATVSRSDHVHSISTGSPATQTPDQNNQTGNSAALSRANHVHNIPTAAPTTNLSGDTLNQKGSNSSFSRSDHVHAILTAPPSTVGGSNQEGVSPSLARADHVHSHGNQPGGSTHSEVTDSVSGFMSATQKAKLDGRKSGLLTNADFSGSPSVATVVFSSPMPDLNYTITITGEDSRVWSYQGKTTDGFIINTNANQLLTGEVSWQAIRVGE